MALALGPVLLAPALATGADRTSGAAVSDSRPGTAGTLSREGTTTSARGEAITAVAADMEDAAAVGPETLAAEPDARRAAREPAIPERVLPAIQVVDARAGREAARNQMPPVTEDGRITLGKRTTVVEMDEQPIIINNNLRQTFARVPGLFISEQQIPSIFNVNYRGLGDPHESEFIGMFENGIPLASDPIGYPMVYYVPPTQRVQRVEFIRGGAGLLHGPQLGPVINFVSRRADPANLGRSITSEQSAGSDGLLSTYNEFGWGDGTHAVYAQFDHRQADGERRNSDFGVFSGRISLAWQPTSATRLGVDVYAYDSDSGEAGRFNLAQFEADPKRTTTPFDRIFIDNHFGAVTLAHDWGAWGTTHARVWGHYQDRFSRRQERPINPRFTNLDRREFMTYGLDVRQVLPWSWQGDHVATVGYALHHTSAPRTRFTNTNLASSAELTPVFRLETDVLYNALFAENAFRFGRFGIAPALRYENVAYQVNEELRLGGRPTRDFDRNVEALLMGLGLTFDFTPDLQAYANASEHYRPPTFDDLLNPVVAAFRPGETGITNSRNYEVGFRGAPFVGARFDVALFHIDVIDRVEQFTIAADTVRQNAGDARHRGVEFDLGYDPLARLNNGQALEFFASASFLDAEITRSRRPGVAVGNTPFFAPDYLARAGIIYRLQDRARVALTSTMVGEQFAQDSNLPIPAAGTAILPAFEVVDLAGEYQLTKSWAVFGGVNNLADVRYFSRVRADGIEPMTDRTIFGGVRFTM
jgi:Fe(3+) dicitrate transport protein